ncbi:MAG: polymerase subunit sigma-70 [Nonomuraea muscovyensis]|nr:polymerase subunit sigma-70 [Nonomuraea muscovyensis]
MTPSVCEASNTHSTQGAEQRWPPPRTWRESTSADRASTGVTVHNTRNEAGRRLGVPPDLFDAHFAEIHRYIARRLSEDVADDLAAEVFVAALQGAYDPAIGAGRPWLYGIATHLVARHRRAEVRRWKAISRTAERDGRGHEDEVLDRGHDRLRRRARQGAADPSQDSPRSRLGRDARHRLLRGPYGRLGDQGRAGDLHRRGSGVGLDRGATGPSEGLPAEAVRSVPRRYRHSARSCNV